jgi:hypothetical protein
VGLDNVIGECWLDEVWRVLERETNTEDIFGRQDVVKGESMDEIG